MVKKLTAHTDKLQAGRDPVKKKHASADKLKTLGIDPGALTERIHSFVGGEWGDVRAYADKIGAPASTLDEYLKGRIPPIEFLWAVARKEGVSLDWLLTGNGAKYPPKIKARKGRTPRENSDTPEAAPSPHRIPILGKVPAGPPGGEYRVEYDAPDLLEELAAEVDDSQIALQVHGDSMFPTLLDGDRVVASLGATCEPGDLVVVEIGERSGEYQIKRLGRRRGKEVTIISDNFLRYEPQVFANGEAHLRGRVVRVVRTPTRRSSYQPGDEAIGEFYRNPLIAQIIEALPSLSEAAQHVIIEHIRALAKAKL